MRTKFDICRWALLALALLCLLGEAQSFCSLEKMKTYAMEACEHLFQQDEGRDKRSLEYSHHHRNRLSYGKPHDKHRYISRSIYPAGGYLKVNLDHFKQLSELDVMPRYKPPRKIHHEKNSEKERFKRDHSVSSYNNIPYCCYNHCDETFFC